MSSINKILFGNGNSAPANILPSPSNDIPAYSSNDEFYRKSVRELEKAKREKLIKTLWPKASPEEVKFATRDLEYMEAWKTLSELEAPIERSFKMDLFVYNMVDKFKRFLKFI